MRLKTLLGKAAGNVLKKPSKEEPPSGPYRFASETLEPSASVLSQTATKPTIEYDSKDTLAATYTPTSDPDIDLYSAPPVYISREPSVASQSMQEPGTRPPNAPRLAPYDQPSAFGPSTANIRVTHVASRQDLYPPAPVTAPPAIPSLRTQRPLMPSSPVPPVPSSAMQRTPRAPAPGDLPIRRDGEQKVTPEELNELADMIRQRYQLDIQIHSERFLRPRDRDITQAKIRKADALLEKIRRTVITWDRPEYFEHGTGNYEAFQEVIRRIMLPGKKDWLNEPPWQNAATGNPRRR